MKLTIARRELLTGASLVGVALALPEEALAAQAEVWNGTGRRPHAIITGSNTGIGKAAAEELARRGWGVTLACRSAGKAEAAAADIVVASGCDAAQIQCMQVDLASLASVRQFSAAWNAKGQPVSALFNNAGVMAVYPQQFTDDGFELTMGVNHLGHFLLTALLEESIRAGSVAGSAGGRVVCTSSAAHLFAQGGMQLDDLFYQQSAYKRWGAYGQSKLANVLMCRELDARCAAISGCGVTAYSFHPGVVDTELARYLLPADAMEEKKTNPERSQFWARKVFGLISPEEGASTGVFLATSPSVTALRGNYFDRSQLGQCSGAGKDMAAAAALWDKSLDLTGAPRGAWTA